MALLQIWADYTREDVHSIFAPHTPFTPQAGTWGLQGMVRTPDQEGNWVFFVTFGQQQGDHAFDESITDEGVLSWQSQPSQRLNNPIVQSLIEHDERVNSIHLFLRTKMKGAYTYLGTLGYLTHDKAREAPVHFQWQLLEWPIPEEVLERVGLKLLHSSPEMPDTEPAQEADSLCVVERPKARGKREGVGTDEFRAKKPPNYAERDQRNRELGLQGELLVVANEKARLIKAGRPDLAENVRHVSVLEGDGAGYDIQSFFTDGRFKYIEVKTTKGSSSTPFFISPNELAFSEAQAASFCLIRVFDFDAKNNVGSAFIVEGGLRDAFELTPTEFRAVLR